MNKKYAQQMKGNDYRDNDVEVIKNVELLLLCPECLDSKNMKWMERGL